ncbi:MAG: hypothetical protein M3Z17_06095 [Gemmatimonadota bacterium]|nr:hypothetical protein [Gemmatimonadota bacterium]
MVAREGAAPAQHRGNYGALPSVKALWFALLGAPFAWSLQELSSYSLSAHACAPRDLVVDTPVLSGLNPLLLLISLAAAIVALAAGVVSLRAWREAQATDEGHHEGAHGGDLKHLSHRAGDVAGDQRTGRARFMALAGILFSSLFLLGIVMNTFPLFTLAFCSAR